jgi:hypothetical protein
MRLLNKKLIVPSMKRTTSAITTLAVMTSPVVLSNSCHVGHENCLSVNRLKLELMKDLMLFIWQKRNEMSRGSQIRTDINGFGDRYSTLELCP